DVTWTCSDPEMVSLFSTSSMGAELFVKTGGTATVTATTASGLSASCTVTTQPTSSFVLNETREVQLYADTPYTRLYLYR
ncbi:MAG: hypothetical protein IKA09_08655, partial [Lachnospiraceae bacterium]|nr:hypothetical protein [Lachnospiraceae bacterium]